MVQRFKLKLYVAQGNCRPALSTLYKALEFHRYSDYELLIIDVDADPDSALRDGVVTTPSLVSETDDRKKILSANLNDIDHLRALFGFKTSAN